MARSHCTNSDKPEKPNPNFPLFAANNGQWGKTIRGKNVYFGVWADPDAALELYYKEKEAWEAGRNPRQAVAPREHQVTVGQMVALCLDAKEALVATGEMKEKTYREYLAIGERLKRVLRAGTPVECVGPADFARLKADFAAGHPIPPRKGHPPRVSKGHKSLVSLKGDVRKTRVFFNFIREAGYIDRVPPYGVFKVPSKKSLRLERKRKPKRLFSAEQVAALIEKASVSMRAMILLGINCAFGDTDCAVLVEDELDLDGGWATFIREKTGVNRRCPLWPETVAALRAVLQGRPPVAQPALANRVFITARGNSWTDLAVCGEFKKVRQAAGLPKGSPGFYGLRHTFVTVARKEITDADAIRTVTGHITNEGDMLSSVYDEDWNDVEDQRIRPVADVIQRWLRSASGESPGREKRADVLPFAAQRSAS
jgi:integrase